MPFISSISIGLLIVTLVGACPDGWVTHSQSCYFFSHDKEGWTEAMSLCKLFGGTLVEIESAAENTYLANKISLSGNRYYIALADIVEEGVWKWMNTGSPLYEGYRNWGPGEPNNYHGQGEDCGIILSDGHWNDGVCHNAEYYICEAVDESGSGSIIG